MLFVTLEDFYQKAASCQRLTRQEELECAERMAKGDAAARQQLIESYLPVAAARVKREAEHMRTLTLALYYVQALEKCVDSFRFQQDSEPFIHRLSWALRQALTRYIAR